MAFVGSVAACGGGSSQAPVKPAVVVASPPAEAAAAVEERWPARCAAGETVDACYERALRLARGEEVEKDEKTSFELFQSACSLGSSIACNGVGWGFIHGRGGARDEAAAGRYFARACPTGNEDHASCDSRGFALLTGFAQTRRDAELATRLLVNACRAGEPYACATLNLYGRLGIPGLTVSQELPLHELGCRLDVQELENICLQKSGPQECWLASMMALTGTCRGADEQTGHELHRAAVRLGVPWPELRLLGSE